MKQLILALGLIIIVVTTACGNRKKAAEIPVRPDMSAFKGKSADKIFCRSDSNNTYSIYLPAAYDTSKLWPVIIAFDSHGDGRLPVSLMKTQAEKYGYIIAGSNNSKNGLPTEVTSAIYDAVIQDVTWRFSVDPQRIYVMGFSGGARVAAYQGIMKGGIRTVIGCSAGLPSNANPSGAAFKYLGVVGTLDFNYLEMKQLFKQLDQTSLPHYLMTFEGIHAWPPPESMEDIFTALQTEGMHAGVVQKDTAWISSKAREFDERVNKSVKGNQYIRALEINNMAKYFFAGFSVVDAFNNKGNEFLKNTQLLKAQQQQETWLAKEQKLQQEYLQYLGSKNSGWWQTETKRLNQVSLEKKGSEEARVHKRLLSYLSLACYMNATQALKTAQWDAFRYFSGVYALVDPENPETAYLNAVMKMKDQKAAGAIADLQQAIKLGFKDIPRLEQDTAFKSLKGSEEFRKLLEEISKQ